MTSKKRMEEEKEAYSGKPDHWELKEDLEVRDNELTIVITLKTIDENGQKIDNSIPIAEITNFAKGYWNCQSVGVAIVR